MANLTEIVATVKDVVRRPDMATLVELRVLSAITACHAVANCVLDREDFEIIVTGGAATVGMATRPADLRTLETVVALDSTGVVIAKLDRCSPAEILKRKRLGTATNTYYEANGKINFNCASPATKILGTGYLQRVEPSLLVGTNNARVPITDPTLRYYSSWLMQQYEIAIIDYAVGMMETLKGNRELGATALDVFSRVHTPYIINLASGYAGQ